MGNETSHTDKCRRVDETMTSSKIRRYRRPLTLDDIRWLNESRGHCPGCEDLRKKEES